MVAIVDIASSSPLGRAVVVPEIINLGSFTANPEKEQAGKKLHSKETSRVAAIPTNP